MQKISYMSLVFRGMIEEYDKAGVHPSVFMGQEGGLNIYLGDPVIDDPKNDEDIFASGLESNGGQFTMFMDTNCVDPNVHYNRSRTQMIASPDLHNT